MEDIANRMARLQAQLDSLRDGADAERHGKRNPAVLQSYTEDIQGLQAEIAGLQQILGEPTHPI